ncbi:hypothetical protein AAF712_000757 [Marasmius tenuissimus]|uniref:Uncharacterized protein n=1 Tax=Marasmius tenuissimus TaxID=585030 RepID=A0ABR3AD18_9AGAR|nr:hypothetical protein PM082_002606 [Marasmius tenuissimus]
MSQVTKGPHPLLVKYLEQLAQHPLRTKAITTGILCFVQEVLASHIAQTPVKKPSKDASAAQHILARARVDARAFKMALYGFLVSAPLSHFLVGLLQKAFAGKTGTKARVGQILASNLCVAPIQASAYLASMAIISGARSFEEIRQTIKRGFFSVVRVTWVVSPMSMAFAQNYLPPHLWVPFFNAIQFVLGTYFNTRVKKLKRQQKD